MILSNAQLDALIEHLGSVPQGSFTPELDQILGMAKFERHQSKMQTRAQREAIEKATLDERYKVYRNPGETFENFQRRVEGKKPLEPKVYVSPYASGEELLQLIGLAK